MSTWYALREFETRDITSRSYGIRHQRDLSASKAREISSNFVQAREYFRNASEADFTVRPLLLYYGVTSLSRGLTLFLDPEKRETSLKNGHGLQVCNWGPELSRGLTEIRNLRVRLTRGLLHDLLAATDNKFYFRHNSSRVNLSLGGRMPARESEFTLREIVARIPQVADQYNVWTDRPMAYAILNSIDLDRETVLYKFSVSGGNPDHIDSVFPIEHYPDRSVRVIGNRVEVECGSSDGTFLSQRYNILDIGHIVLFGPLYSNLYVTPLAACFIVSFILGMMCRYYPTSWIRLSRTEKGDAFLSVGNTLVGLDRGSFSCDDCRYSSRTVRLREKDSWFLIRTLQGRSKPVRPGRRASYRS